MTDLAEFSTHELLERLPPIDKAPILEKLATLGLRRFQNEHAIPTPVDRETGLVDHEALMNEMRLLVDPQYKWQAPFFDEHHLYWYAHRYKTSFQPNPALAVEFRDSAFNKFWAPRQYHDFLHTVTVPSDVPSTDRMRSEVKNYRRKSYIYRITTNAIVLSDRLSRIKPQNNRGDIMYIDPETRSITRNPEALDQWREEFIRYIERSHRKGLIDLSQLATIDLTDIETVVELLPQIRDLMDEGLVRHKGKAALGVNIPFEKVA
ncbi:MAG: hypothetical protein JWN33_387 [Candidatus Saccharibacteria bacterium]|nr:hypothetical protein [Candidatus Saccharibacteria bacterium]